MSIKPFDELDITDPIMFGHMTYEFDLHESKEEGRVEGKVEGHNDALAVAQDMKLSPELIAEFKARLEAKNTQK